MNVRSADGTTIAFDTYGEGPPLILVGGAFQHRAMDERTAELAQRLGERFTAYHYDRRGRGDSTDTATTKRWRASCRPRASTRASSRTSSRRRCGAFSNLAPTLVYDTTMMADPGLLGDRAPKVAVPLLVIDGGDSPPWASECAEAVAGAVPDARRHTIPGQTHEVSTDALAPVLLDWF
jgi:pimeloyl-ACP methyl ester carboxylesterase